MGLVTRIGYPIDASANFLLASEPQNGQSRVVSHYLNAITDSAQRATVLSFKGLAFNLWRV